MVHAHSSNMHTKIVECVPNFSEGQDQGVIDKITKAIKSTPGVTLLGADPGWSPNRTVYTFVGSPEAVVLGALNGARVAYKYIDMTKHKGEHPRLGALDVCPFTPVRGADMEDCVSCARKFGEKLSEELNVPVYLYGFAAHHDYRRIAPQIRSGEYEGLSEKILKPEWKPDYGPAEFVPRWGATMSGAHVYLIAYNINLLSTKEQAHRIALDIREKGRGKDKPGLLKKIQAKGWWLEESNIAQVSVNVVDNDITPIHVVFEEVLRIANSLKLPVTGSEIVGVVPLKAILEAAEFYMKRDNLFVLEEDQKVRLAIHRLGLNSLSPFDPAQRIIEYMLPDDRLGPQAERTLAQFIHPVRARTPTPGGGSVDAAVASLAAHTLPEKTPEEEEAREATVQASLKRAIAVHLGVARSVSKLWELATTTSIDARADLQVGARCLETSAFGAYRNVILNCQSLQDEMYRDEVLKEIEQCCDDSRQ
ncbi:formimidoyltransferase-cyclodeaminase-like isoform X4 [Haemaphysalis longicornis]